jgi:hypothetical protein
MSQSTGNPEVLKAAALTAMFGGNDQRLSGAPMSLYTNFAMQVDAIIAKAPSSAELQQARSLYSLYAAAAGKSEAATETATDLSALRTAPTA